MREGVQGGEGVGGLGSGRVCKEGRGVCEDEGVGRYVRVRSGVRSGVCGWRGMDCGRTHSGFILPHH